MCNDKWNSAADFKLQFGDTGHGPWHSGRRQDKLGTVWAPMLQLDVEIQLDSNEFQPFTYRLSMTRMTQMTQPNDLNDLNDPNDQNDLNDPNNLMTGSFGDD